MDDQSALIQDYEITIDSMRREIQTLQEKLEEPIPTSAAQEEYDRCEELIEINRQEIEGNTADIAEEKRKLRCLKAEEEWIKANSPE
jgi:peptidoglycan hydrolase CwlO-like protein